LIWELGTMGGDDDDDMTMRRMVKMQRPLREMNWKSSVLYLVEHLKIGRQSYS
jgi:hypothetical protein